MVEDCAECAAKLTKKKGHGTENAMPLYFAMLLKCALTPDFSVAVAAVYRSPAPWLERHLGVFATGGADSGMHLPLLLRAVPIRAAE